MFNFRISKNKLMAVQRNYQSNGIVPRETNTKGKIWKAALSFEDVQRVVVFLQNYAIANTVMLPD